MSAEEVAEQARFNFWDLQMAKIAELDWVTVIDLDQIANDPLLAKAYNDREELVKELKEFYQ